MLRKIHLDFHTAPETEGIGKDFDPERFAETLAAAHVNYLATPGKCHYGHVYYDARIAIPHPHLEDPEMFPRTINACLRRGIKTQAYWTLGLDATRAKLNPEWRQTFADGTYANWGHYLHICFASPYVEQVVIPEVQECIERCPEIVGFWFDIALYVDGAFYAEDFNRLATEELGEQADDVQARWHLARKLIRRQCIRIDEAIKSVMPGAENFFNTLVNPGESENLGLVALNEIENPILFQGPEKMSAYIRWLRGQGVPSIGLVSRFQGPWSDPGTLRTSQQMRFDVARTIALGCDISMGDHRYPDGHLEPEAYRRLAPVYGEVAELEAVLEAATPQTEALLAGSVEAFSGKGLLSPEFTPLTKHAARVLEELGVQFNLATTADPWPETDCIIYLGEEPPTPEVQARLRKHVAEGGALLAMDHAIDGAGELFPATVVPWEAPQQQAVDDMGNIGHVGTVGAEADAAGPAGHFIRMDPEVAGGRPGSPCTSPSHSECCRTGGGSRSLPTAADSYRLQPTEQLAARRPGADFPYLLTLPARILQADDDADVLAWRHLPVGTRPPFASPQADSPLVVQKGRVIYASPNLFAEAVGTGAPQPPTMVDALLRRLIPRRLVEHDAGPSVAAHLHEIPGGRLLHLVHWALDRWDKQINSATTFPVLAEIKVTLRVEEPVESVACLPDGQELEFTQQDDVVSFTLPRLHIWQVVHVQTKCQP
jgi:hypothetical protein